MIEGEIGYKVEGGTLDSSNFEDPEVKIHLFIRVNEILEVSIECFKIDDRRLEDSNNIDEVVERLIFNVSAQNERKVLRYFVLGHQIEPFISLEKDRIEKDLNLSTSDNVSLNINRLNKSIKKALGLSDDIKYNFIISSGRGLYTINQHAFGIHLR